MRSCCTSGSCFWVVPCMLIMNGIEVCSIGVPCGRVMACTREMPSTAKIAFAILSMHQHVRRVAQIVVALDHQHFRVHPGLREVPVRGGVPLVGRGWSSAGSCGRCSWSVAGQRQQSDQCQRHRGDQDRARPADHGGADPAPPRASHRALGLQQAEPAADGDHRAHPGSAPRSPRPSCRSPTGHPCLEVGQPGEAQTERRAGDRQSGAQDHVRGALIHRVVGRFPVLAVYACLLIAADQEYRVVGRRRRSPASPAGWSRTSTAR